MRYFSSYSLVLSFLIACFLFIHYDLASPEFYGTDLTRYYIQYLELTPEFTLSGLFDALTATSKDQAFNLIFYFQKILGLPFYTLLFGLQFLYFYSSFRLFSSISKEKSILGFIIVYLYLSLFISSLTLVALRQGVALYVLLYCVLPSLINRNHIKSLFFFMVSISMHLSSILSLPFLFALKYIPKCTRYIYMVYPLFMILYYFEAPSFIQPILQSLPDNLARALLNNDSGYEVGVTLGKALAITIPWLIYRLSKEFVLKNKLLYFLYAFQFYIFEIGILFSGIPYHDRIFLVAWPISPAIVTASSFFLFNKYVRLRYSK